MRQHDSRTPLERWDPAAELEPAALDLEARIRSRLAGAPEPAWISRGREWRWNRLSFAAVAAALVILVAVALTRVELERGASGKAPRIAMPASDLATLEESVQMVYTASNGVRIYWSVSSSSDS